MWGSRTPTDASVPGHDEEGWRRMSLYKQAGIRWNRFETRRPDLPYILVGASYPTTCL